jgi:hypothetical protein
MGSLARQQAHERNKRIGPRRWAALRRYWLSRAHTDPLTRIGRRVRMAKSMSVLLGRAFQNRAHPAAERILRKIDFF